MRLDHFLPLPLAARSPSCTSAVGSTFSALFVPTNKRTNALTNDDSQRLIAPRTRSESQSFLACLSRGSLDTAVVLLEGGTLRVHKGPFFVKRAGVARRSSRRTLHRPSHSGSLQPDCIVLPSWLRVSTSHANNPVLSSPSTLPPPQNSSEPATNTTQTPSHRRQIGRAHV